MKWVALLPLWLLSIAMQTPAEAATLGEWRICDGPPWLASSSCAPTALQDVDPQGRMLWLTADVRLDRAAAEPQAVFVSAYASSAVYWDGRLVGTNGVPSERPEHERPGLRDAAFPIPEAAAGNHELTVQLSSHNGLLRLRSPVTQVSVAPFEGPAARVMRGYLPALICAGALAVAALILAFFWWGGRGRPGSAYLLGAALFATAQLLAEASRAFVAYPYPLQFLRIVLVLAFAAGFGFMLLGYIARRFGAARLWPILLAQALAATAAILLVPSFDQRTALVLASAMAIGLLLTTRAAARSEPGTLALGAMLALGLVAALGQPYSFLDRDFYLWSVALFVLLLAGEARWMKAAPPAAEADPRAGAPAGLHLGTGADRRFLLPADVVRVAAADDYCEVFLLGGGSLLHPEPLQKLLERLPAEFLRVHRSHAVNLAHLRSFRRGASNSVVLSDQSVAPVSRRRVATLLAALEG